MGSKVSKKVPSSDNNTEIKYHECVKMFIACVNGILLEFSMIENKVVHEFGRIPEGDIESMAKTLDNRS